MTVDELRKAIEGVPGDMEVFRYDDYCQVPVRRAAAVLTVDRDGPEPFDRNDPKHGNMRKTMRFLIDA